jgi:hypothetical protein
LLHFYEPITAAAICLFLRRTLVRSRILFNACDVHYCFQPFTHATFQNDVLTGLDEINMIGLPKCRSYGVLRLRCFEENYNSYDDTSTLFNRIVNDAVSDTTGVDSSSLLVT